jgi:hypothetical protein
VVCCFVGFFAVCIGAIPVGIIGAGYVEVLTDMSRLLDSLLFFFIVNRQTNIAPLNTHTQPQPLGTFFFLSIRRSSIAAARPKRQQEIAGLSTQWPAHTTALITAHTTKQHTTSAIARRATRVMLQGSNSTYSHSIKATTSSKTTNPNPNRLSSSPRWWWNLWQQQQQQQRAVAAVEKVGSVLAAWSI